MTGRSDWALKGLVLTRAFAAFANDTELDGRRRRPDPVVHRSQHGQQRHHLTRRQIVRVDLAHELALRAVLRALGGNAIPALS